MRRNGSLPVKTFSLAVLFTAVGTLAGAIGIDYAHADDFVVNDRIISEGNSDVPAPEFDESTSSMFWQDRFNNLWVATVDDDTGAISPGNGQGVLIDTGLAPVGEVGNTPRISYGDEDVLIYTDEVDGVKWLAVAQSTGPGQWTTQLLEQGDNRLRANGTPFGFSGTPRMVYNRVTESGDIVVSYRDWNDPATEGTANVIAEGGRFLGTEPSVLTLTNDESGFTQILLIDLETGDGEVITDSPTSKINPFIWFAPEFNDFAFVVMLNFTELAVYRRVDGVWTEYNRFAIPAPGKPFLSSPEAFAHNGRSYITVVAAEALGTSDTFPGQPVGPSEIWLAGIDPTKPLLRRLDDPSADEQRSEPEPYQLTTGPAIYYTEKAQTFPFNRRLRLADTGLGPDFAYDLPTSYGGAWSGVNRDNRNSNSVPFPLADRFEAAEPVDLPGVHLRGASLAGDGTLLFTNRNVNLGTEELIALDTATGLENFRVPSVDVGEGLSNAPVLVDRDNNFYVSATDVIAKFDASGNQLWSQTIAGYSLGAQFLPDGQLVLFTWNGWGYLIDPATGDVILEQNLTPGRPFPPAPNCLSGGAAGGCAYARPLAVDASTGTIYASITSGRGRGFLQAWAYDAGLNQFVDQWAAGSVAFPAPVGTPVLSDNGATVYVQSTGGVLSAVDTATQTVRWNYFTGAASDTPPALSGDLLLVGGLAADGATTTTVIRDDGTRPVREFRSADFLPRSFAAAGADDRFVIALEDAVSGELVLGVIDVAAGTVTTSPWPAGATPTTLRSLTVRQDGTVVVQAWGASDNVVVFTPAL